MKRRTVSATPSAGARGSKNAQNTAESRIRAIMIRTAPPVPQTLRDPFPQSHTLTQAACRRALQGCRDSPIVASKQARRKNMMSAAEIAFATALELVELYRGKALSPVEVAQALFT